MADTIEEQILDNLKTALEAISTSDATPYRNTVQHVSLNAEDSDTMRAAQGAYPAISIHHVATDYVPQTGGWEEATMQVFLLCYGNAYGIEERKQFAEDILDDVKRVIYSDVTIGDTASDCWVSRKEDNKSHPDAEAQGGQVAEVAIALRVRYERQLRW